MNKLSTHDPALKLYVIKTKEHVYISDNNNPSYSHSSRIPYYIIDGEKAEETYRKDWFKVKSAPSKIQQEVAGKKINIRYEIKPEHEGINLPKIATNEDFQDGGKLESVYGLYEKKYDMTEPTVEDIPFELHIVEELDQFEITKSEFKPEYSLLDRINFHPVLLSTRPCKLSKAESYSIIRSHIKKNIDARYAKITSDYDFCLSVSKGIEHDPIAYTVNVGKRKPKYETRYHRERWVKVYEATPSKYDKYPDVVEFYGLNEEDLKKNINEYLDNLMKKINEPLIECSCCEGTGVIKKEEN